MWAGSFCFFSVLGIILGLSRLPHDMQRTALAIAAEVEAVAAQGRQQRVLHRHRALLGSLLRTHALREGKTQCVVACACVCGCVCVCASVYLRVEEK